jgi:formylglycine-generating enzyme required for sulfatase activity
MRVCDASGCREVVEADFPLAVGVSSEGLIVFGSEVKAAPAAWFGHNNRKVFLQADGGLVSVQLNGKELNGSEWLVAGDELQIDSNKFTVNVDTDMVMLSPAGRRKEPAHIPPDTPLTTAGQAKEIRPRPAETELTVDEPAKGQPKISAVSSFDLLQVKKGHPRLRKVITVFFVILLLCVIFVLTAVPVRITITPSPDTTSLSRFPLSVKVGERYLVLPGRYRVFAEKEGYQKLEASITVEFGSDSTFVYQLRKLPGLLDVVSLPVQDAEVRVDGSVIGKTPLASIEIEEGRHKLSVAAQRYLPNLQSIEIQGMGVRQRIEVVLQPGWGSLRIESKPDGADVWLKGAVVGQTPLQIEPMGGVYTIELRKDGWKPILDKIKIEPGETVKMLQFALQKVEGVLELTSRPSGASVMLNGEFRGQTPTSLSIIQKKDHQLSLSRSGFITVSRSIRIIEAKVQHVDIQLEPEYGIVFITSQPADAKLTVDGKVMGAASRRLRLTTLPHRIVITRAGYEPFKTTLTPTAGVSKKLDVQLKSNRQTMAAAKSTEIKTAEGQVLHRILLPEPVQFQMGASRREPGRRSNESQYPVELTRTFYVSEKEVTNAEFQKFQQGHNSGSESSFDLNERDQPVVSVQWDDAAAYLYWLSEKDGLPPAYEEKDGKMVVIVPITTGYRLPTEAEWAFIARYEGGNPVNGKPLKYPWGNDRFPPKKSGNYADSSAANSLPLTIKGYTDGYRATAPVGRFPANSVGIYDLGGNVSEWCHDYYDVYSGGQTKVLRDPTGPATGKYHVVRGAGWRHGSIRELRLSYRDYAEKPRNDIGFRIARYAE